MGANLTYVYLSTDYRKSVPSLTNWRRGWRVFGLGGGRDAWTQAQYAHRVNRGRSRALGGRLIRAHTTGQGLVVRAHIVVLAHDHPDWSNQQLAQTVGTSDRMVRK